MRFFYILFGSILISLIVIAVGYFFRIDPKSLAVSKTDWASVFLAFAAILIAILLIFNFIYVKQIMDISEEAKKSIIEVPKLQELAQNMDNRIKEIENFSNKKELERSLKGLRSTKNKNKRQSSAQIIGELGNEIYLDALNYALSRETEEDVKRDISIAIGKISERLKYRNN